MAQRTIRLARIGLLALVGAGCGGNNPEPEPEGCRADPLEPNDTRMAAAAVAAGAQAGLIACAGEEDWYKVTLAVGETLKVNADFQGPPESLRVTVHESTQGAPIVKALPGGGGLEAQVQPGRAGEYFVRVAAGDSDTKYDLAVAVSPPAKACAKGLHPQNGGCVKDGCDDLGFEANNDVPTARPLLPGKYKGLSICDATDRDFYAVPIPPGGAAITAKIALASRAGDLDLYVTDGTMSGGKYKVLGAGRSDADVDWATNVPVGEGGQAYLMVVGDQGAVNDYDLELFVEPLDKVRDCLIGCNQLMPMVGAVDPSEPEAIMDGYFVGTEAKYAYVRRDLAMQLQSAFARTLKQFPGTKPPYLSDISQKDGKTPGVDRNRPRHATSTHVNGRDADIAYYQTLEDNDYRIICGDGTDYNNNGVKGKFNDGYFCTTDKTVVDHPRQSYFIALLMGGPQFRVLGVDKVLPDPLFDAVDVHVKKGVLPEWALHRFEYGLAWGSAGGWQFHHHHMHVSYNDL